MEIKLLESPKPDLGLDAYARARQAFDNPGTDYTTETTDNLETGGATYIQDEETYRDRLSSQEQRFIGGSTFFNCDACGSLRPDKPAIELFSYRYGGLAVHVLMCGFAFHFFSYGFGQLLAEYLRANNEQQVHAANYVLVWPQGLVVFIGLLSDPFPLFQYRRKSYMLFGWMLSLVIYIAIIVMDIFGDSGLKLYASAAKDLFDSRDESAGSASNSRYPIAYLIVSLLAAVGIQFSWIGAVIVSVELAQRESMHPRGLLQGTLLALYYFGGFVAKIVTGQSFHSI